MKKSIIVLLVTFFIVSASTISAFQILNVPSKAQLVDVTETSATTAENIQCKTYNELNSLDINGHFSVLVWNIYKQNKESLYAELEQLASSSELSLLQEVSLDETFKQWLLQHDWVGQQVNAFKAFEVSAGVFNISNVLPSKICAEVEKEPWLQLPKSALFALYPLSTGDSLAVANIHAINFTIGTKAFEAQLAELAKRLNLHTGPVLFAGDFNTWSDARMERLKSVMKTLGLTEVIFSPDNRKQFINGLALDHVYYRGLSLKTAKAPQSDASDHNPMLVEFSLK